MCLMSHYIGEHFVVVDFVVYAVYVNSLLCMCLVLFVSGIWVRKSAYVYVVRTASGQIHK